MICVIGLGYIGLPTALMFAKSGKSVIGIDYNSSLVEKLKNGQVTFEEKGLKELYDEAVKGQIEFTDEYVSSDMYIIAVPTPYESVSKKIDATYVVNAVKNVLDVCQDGAVIAIESTVSPGTIDRFVRPCLKMSKKNVWLAHVPERIIPGNMITELENNNRTIGVDDVKIGEQLKELYSSFCKGILTVTDIRTAEMTKVVENTYRDVNIALANELAKICDRDGLDVYEVIRIANMHPRVNILQPGPGVGGHCISVDPWFLVGDHPAYAKLIHEARNVNDSMPEYVWGKMQTIMKKEGITTLDRVGLYGLTYKADVDDIRESPTLKLIDIISNSKSEGKVKIYDPMIKNDVVSDQCHSLDDFLDSIDMVVILVGHSEIKICGNKLDGKIVYDTRNVREEGTKIYKL